MSSGIARKFTDLMHQEPVVMWSCMIGALGEFFLRLLLLLPFFFFNLIFKCFLSLLTTREKSCKVKETSAATLPLMSALLTPPLSYFLLSFLSFFSFFLSRRGVGSNRFGPSAHRASNTGVVRNKAHTATTTYEGTSGGTFFPSRLLSLCA